MSIKPTRMMAAIAACLLTVLLAVVTGTASAQEFRTALQISPQGGGKCIDVPDREFFQNEVLQMRDCNNSPGQVFTRDQANMRLMIGGLCVDADGGQPGDLVKLASCDGGANQVWKVDQKGNFAKLVGVNGLCLDIRYGSTESGAPVQSWTCEDAAPNQLWTFQRK
jgi:Ricin-type beta-trefoil lectin domain